MSNIFQDINLIVEEKPGVWTKKTIYPSRWKIAEVYKLPKETHIPSYKNPSSDEDYNAYQYFDNLIEYLEDLPSDSKEGQIVDKAVDNTLDNIVSWITDFEDTLKNMSNSIKVIMRSRYTLPIKDDIDYSEIDPNATKPDVLWDLIVRLSEINDAFNGIEYIGKLISDTAGQIGKKADEFDIRQKFIGDSLSDEGKIERQIAVMKLVNLVLVSSKTIGFLMDELRSYISVDKIDRDYLRILNLLHKIARFQNNFETNFKNIYDNYLKDADTHVSSELESTKTEIMPEEGFAQTEMIDFKPDEKKVDEELLPTEPSPNAENLPQHVLQKDISLQEEGDDEEEPPPSQRPETLRSLYSWINEAPDYIRPSLIKVQHTKFVEELKKAASNDDPYILAAMVCKYSEHIEDIDPESSLKLIAIAEGILGD